MNNFVVTWAKDGLEALRILEERSFDLAILDVMMPKMDGYQTLRELRANKHLKDTRVIFLSAKSKVADIEKGLKLGADSYMTKPFSIKKVVADIEKMIT